MIRLPGWLRFELGKLKVQRTISTDLKLESHVLKNWRPMSLPNSDLWKLVLTPMEEISVFKSSNLEK